MSNEEERKERKSWDEERERDVIQSHEPKQLDQELHSSGRKEGEVLSSFDYFLLLHSMLLRGKISDI